MRKSRVSKFSPSTFCRAPNLTGHHQHHGIARCQLYHWYILCTRQVASGCPKPDRYTFFPLIYTAAGVRSGRNILGITHKNQQHKSMSKYMCIRLICAIYKHKDIPLTLDCAASQSDCFYLGVARETAPGSAAPATASARQTARIRLQNAPGMQGRHKNAYDVGEYDHEKSKTLNQALKPF